MNLPIITCLGSCRLLPVEKYFSHTKLNEIISFTHNTKEVIQLLKFINNEINIPENINRFCFRTGILNKSNILLHHLYKEAIQNTNIFIIELCSNKCYINNNYYLHHLAVDTRFAEYKDTPTEIINTTNIHFLEEEEIEADLLFLLKYLKNKKILIITHYNVYHNNELLTTRNNLINSIENICKKHQIPLFNPSILFQQYKQNDIIQNDYGHLTNLGKNIAGLHLRQTILELFK
jgi:hypothetical protein